jgi:hypothetical protein
LAYPIIDPIINVNANDRIWGKLQRISRDRMSSAADKLKHKIKSRFRAAVKLARKREGVSCRRQVDAEEGRIQAKAKFRRGPQVNASYVENTTTPLLNILQASPSASVSLSIC